MKNIFKYLTLAAAAVCFVSCFQEKSEIPTYEPAAPVEGNQFYFAADIAQSYTIKPTTTEFKLPLRRYNSEAAATASIAVTDTSKVMFAEGTATLTVDFSKDSSVDTLVIPIDYSKFNYGDLFGVDLKISKETTPYGSSELHIEVALPEPWKSLGIGLYRDNMVSTFFGVDPTLEWEVEIEENELYPGLYRVLNAYGENYPYNDPGDWDDSKDYYMVIHAEDPTAVWIETYYSEMEWSYGQFIFASMAGYQIENGKTLAEVKAAGYTGTLENGIITMPVKGMLIAMSGYNNGGLYYGNNEGLFRVVLPGTVLSDYTIEMQYEGLLIDKNTGAEIASGEISFVGEDVNTVSVALVAGDDSNVAAALLEAEVPEGEEVPNVVSLEASGRFKIALPELSDYYTLLAVPTNSEGEFEWEYAIYETFQHKDFTVGIEAKGTETDINGKGTAAFSVAIGADVEFAKVAFIAGEDAEAALALIMADDESVVKVEESKDLVFDIPDGVEGKFIAVAVSFAYGEAWYLASAKVEYYAVSPWESMGYVMYTDDMIGPLFQAPVVSYYVPLEKNNLVEGLYRLVNAYGEYFPYNEPGDWDDSKDYYLEIHAENPDQVYFLEQDTGCNWGYGSMRVVSNVGRYIAAGYSADVIIANLGDIFGKLSDNKITFPEKSLIIFDDDGGYYGNQNTAFCIDFNDIVAELPAAGAPKQVKRVTRNGRSFQKIDKLPGMGALISVEKGKYKKVNMGVKENVLDNIEIASL